MAPRQASFSRRAGGGGKVMGKVYRYTRAQVESARGPAAIFRMLLGIFALFLALNGDWFSACFILAYQTLNRMWDWLDPIEVIEPTEAK